MKKDYSELYGDALLLSVNDYLQSTPKAVSVSTIVENIFTETLKGYERKKAVLRVRRCAKMLVESNRATLHEEKTKFKTTLHLYRWKQ